MIKLKTKTALAAVTLAAAALATPLSASAADYRKCNDTTNGVAGGLIGGTVGAAIGEEIAGRGDRTEGAVLGAIIGGIAGAAIGDGASDCEKDNRYNNRQVVTTQYPTRTVTTTRGYQTVGHNGHNRRTTTTRNYGYDRGYSRRVDPLYRIDREIDQTRREGDRLKRQLRNSRGYRPGLHRALEANGRHLKYLKRERKRIKKSYNNGYRNYR
ncbi:MAG: glycine zipper 2TM domain-containing protein [Litorimonas sp.]